MIISGGDLEQKTKKHYWYTNKAVVIFTAFCFWVLLTNNYLMSIPFSRLSKSQVSGKIQPALNGTYKNHEAHTGPAKCNFNPARTCKSNLRRCHPPRPTELERCAPSLRSGHTATSSRCATAVAAYADLLFLIFKSSPSSSRLPQHNTYTSSPSFAC